MEAARTGGGRHFTRVTLRTGAVTVLTGGGSRASVGVPTRSAGIDDWESFFRTVFDRSGNPMTLIDERLTRVDVNPATCALYGVGRERLVGRRIDGMLLGGRLPVSAPTWDEVMRRGAGTGEAIVVRPDGGQVDVEFAAQPGVIGGRPLVLVVVTAAEDEDPLAAGGLGDTPLTAREHEIVRRLALGLTSREIAGEMVLSHETVRTHVRNAMGKVEARTRAQLVAIALVGRMLQPTA
ncbi:MAG: LuxR C-terminal-related transcriptional regulator [Thermoleophilia bacterium]